MQRLFIAISFIAVTAVTVFGQADRLGTRQWKLAEINGEDVSDMTAYIELNQQQTRMTGHSGCNRIFGGVSVTGRRIDFAGIGSTKMGCADRRIQRVETLFVEGLAKADRFSRNGNVLEIYDRRRLIMKLTLQGRRPDDGPIGSTPLETRKWTLEAIKGVPVAKIGRTAFLVFDQDKRSAGGNSSCNVFGGSYTANGTKLQITDVVSTMRACVEDSRMAIERQFLDGLRNANRYEIKRDRLMLYRNTQLLLTLAGENK
jgi:heat shock protein HslJ